MYVHTYTLTYVHVYLRMHMDRHMIMHVLYAQAHILTWAHEYTHLLTCMYIQYIRTYIYAHIHTSQHMHTHTYVHPITHHTHTHTCTLPYTSSIDRVGMWGREAGKDMVEELDTIPSGLAGETNTQSHHTIWHVIRVCELALQTINGNRFLSVPTCEDRERTTYSLLRTAGNWGFSGSFSWKGERIFFSLAPRWNMPLVRDGELMDTLQSLNACLCGHQSTCIRMHTTKHDMNISS